MKCLRELASKQLEDHGGFLPFVYCAVLALFLKHFRPLVWPPPMLCKHHLSPASSCYGPFRQTALTRVEQKEGICLMESTSLRATALG